MTKVLIIIPAFNESANVGRVVNELHALDGDPSIVVLSDGSTDDTARLAREAGARVVSLAVNCGIGATVQTGLRLALREGYDIIVRADGDGQHDARDVPELIERIALGRADFVLGSRHLEGRGFQAGPLRRLGIRWFRVLLRFAGTQPITDPTSGFWAANRRAAAVLLDRCSPDYPEVGSLVELSRAGCRLEEIPVTMRARTAGRSSIEGRTTLYYMIKVSIAVMVARLSKPPRGGGATERER